MRTIFLLLFLFSFQITIAQRAVLNAIVKIQTYDNNGNLGASGTGIIVGQSGSEVLIITAYHVVEEATDIKVKLSGLGQTLHTARLYPNLDEDLDLAVLVIDVPFLPTFDFYTFQRTNFEKLKLQDKVKVIGFPYGSGIERPLIKPSNLDNLYYLSEDAKMSASAIGIQRGFSGGVIIDKRNRIVGMVTDVSGSLVIATKIDKIVRKLADWDINYNYIQPYKEPFPTISYVLGGMAVTSAGLGIYYNGEAADHYQLYKEFRDPNALKIQFNDNSLTRDDVLQDAKKDGSLRDVFYVASGACAATALVFAIVKKKDRKIDTSNLQNSNLKQEDFYSRIQPQIGPGQVGIIIKLY